MGHKIFVSYKYNDDSVQRLPNTPWYAATTVRDYVDILEDYIELTNHQYKGESDGEDLSDYSDDEIWEKLKDRIYDSSVTIVLISPNMKEENRYDKSQWIPWEIYYSLRETTRRDRTSHSNAVLAVVLPDKYGNYDYFMEDKNCCSTKCTIYKIEKLFHILDKNMFNQIYKVKNNCTLTTVYIGEFSYIKAVKWDEFMANKNDFIEKAIRIKENINDYEICKSV